MIFLEVSGIGKQQQGAFVLKDISFTQQQFKRIAIAGETGSGKSTLLKIIAGLAQPDAGVVMFEGNRVLGPDEKLIPGHPGISYLSQQFELLNNYRVEEVLEYANKLSGEEAAELYGVCRIIHLLKRKTDQLSGGEKQRIAMARLLTASPRLLLLDEPYSNLDMIHKNILKLVVRDIGEKLDITCLLISHDPLDTLSWADEIIVMKDGKIVQKGSPEEIYSKPVNEYTAALFGRYNLVSPALSEAFAALIGAKMGGENLFIRPESFRITDTSHQAISGEVKEVIFLGSAFEIEVLIEGEPIFIKTLKSNFAKGDNVFVSLNVDKL